MNCNGTQGLTELEFFREVKERNSPEECGGPIVYLRLSEAVASILLEATGMIEKDELVGNAYISRISSRVALFGSCMSHWIDIAAITVEMGKNSGRADFHLAGNSIFVECCNQAAWDYKELDNFLNNLDMDEESRWQE